MLVKNVSAGGIPAPAAQAMGGTPVTIAATGSTQANSTAVTSDLCNVTAADGTKGVVLPLGNAGDSIVLGNLVAQALIVWPPVGAAINAIAANSSFSQSASKNAVYYYFSATQIFAVLSA